MSKGGFDPERMGRADRERPVIPQILSPETQQLAKGFTEIKVVGLGGAGSNTIDRMIESGVQGIDFIAVNSDSQMLERSLARKRVNIGGRLTRGLGAGGNEGATIFCNRLPRPTRIAGASTRVLRRGKSDGFEVFGTGRTLAGDRGRESRVARFVRGAAQLVVAVA